MSVRPLYLAPLAALALFALHGCSPAPVDPGPTSRLEAEGTTLVAPGPVTLVTDLNPAPLIRRLGVADEFVRMGNHVYFTATGAGLGRELWRTDGTEAGTWRVKALPRVWWDEGSSMSHMLAVEPEGRLI